MPAKKFRFVSPGIQIKEIDKSILPAEPGAIGPVVIGRSLKGPSMVPVTVRDYEEFVQKFGEPDVGLGSSDVWRNGNNTGPTYGALAAKAWLASSSPLTFLRLAGVANKDATEEGKAGWQVPSPTTSSATNGGAFGLFLVPSGSNQVGTLGAVFYLDKGAIELLGTDTQGSAIAEGQGSNVMVQSLANAEFKIRIVDSNGDEQAKVAFNFDKNSSKFIRKVFNTNPTLTNAAIYSETKPYWLGETFEDSLNDLGILDDKSAGKINAFVASLKGANAFRHEAKPASTGWVISQHLNAETSEFDPATDCEPLFKIVCGEGLGSEWEQNNYKVSIFDVKSPTSEFEKYGTFSVGVRHIGDTDKSPEFLEVFSNLNLNPNSPNYIAARIGDRKVVWHRDADGEERYVELGSFANNSKIIRVEMNPRIEIGAVDPAVLPAGFIGPKTYNMVTITGTSGLNSDTDSVLQPEDNPFTHVSGVLVDTGISDYTASIMFPSLKLVHSASDVGVLDPTQAFFGVDFGEPLSDSVKDLLKIKPSGLDEELTQENSFVFTLDDIELSESASIAVWKEDSRKNGTSYSAQNDFADLLELGFNKFTMPLAGGFDGLDITEREPFRNTLLETGTVKTNYALNSAKRALLSVKDPEVLDMNLLVMPGITVSSVTDQMLRVCETRADALAIIDVPGGYVPDTENSDPETSRLGGSQETVTKVKERVFNSSYGCTYYPWVQMRDEGSGVKVWIPPSIVAFGTMASSQERSEVWFAPAGFNRGGLSLGSSGLSIVAVREKLTSKKRDALYERNVNPIANFPSEGLVIFGQKTLQAVPSALDRINVRRLVIFLKKEISKIAADILFEPNVQDTWKRFKIPTVRLLDEVKTGFGISDYRVVLDESTTTAEEIDRNMLYAKLFIKPVYAIEFIGIDFVITNTGASFDDL